MGFLEMDGNVTWPVLAMVCAVGSGVAWLTWFISNQFRESRALAYRMMSLHNREDDERFEALSHDIWTIHLRNAQRDGDKPPERKTFPRRRYLQEVEQEVTG